MIRSLTLRPVEAAVEAAGSLTGLLHCIPACSYSQSTPLATNDKQGSPVATGAIAMLAPAGMWKYRIGIIQGQPLPPRLRKQTGNELWAFPRRGLEVSAVGIVGIM